MIDSYKGNKSPMSRSSLIKKPKLNIYFIFIESVFFSHTIYIFLLPPFLLTANCSWSFLPSCQGLQSLRPK